MIDVIGTEEYLTKIDWSHTIVFSATYGFPRGLVYINELVPNAKFKLDALRRVFDSPKRQSQSGIRRDLQP
jgi:hypothetical protein